MTPYELPPILSGTAEEQLQQLREYLLRLAMQRSEGEEKGQPGPQGPKGERGPAGPKGEPGKFPVGYVYISTDATNPAELLGFGTWERFAEGRVLLSASDEYPAGTQGGEAEVTLTVDEMPSHEHKFARQQWYSRDAQTSASTSTIYSWRGSVTGTSASFMGVDGDYGETGGSQPHNNMPPYIAVYIWQRTA